MKTGILCNRPLETALKNAGFKVNGIERKGKKTVIIVEPAVLKGSTGSDTTCCENLCIGTIQGNRN